MPRVHPGKEQEIVDHAGEAIGLVMQCGKVVVHDWLKIFAAQQFLNPGAQDGHRRFQLMRRVG